MKETPHFQIGHMCAGCKISNYLHTGCVVNENVRMTKIKHNMDIKDKSIVEKLPVDVQVAQIATITIFS